MTFRVLDQRADFVRVSRFGSTVSGSRSSGVAWFQAKALVVEPNPEKGRKEGLYFGTVTPREVGGAVVRNRLRRRVRACLRELDLEGRSEWSANLVSEKQRFMIVFYFRKAQLEFYQRQSSEELRSRVLQSLEYALERACSGRLGPRSR